MLKENYYIHAHPRMKLNTSVALWWAPKCIISKDWVAAKFQDFIWSHYCFNLFAVQTRTVVQLHSTWRTDKISVPPARRWYRSKFWLHNRSITRTNARQVWPPNCLVTKMLKVSSETMGERWFQTKVLWFFWATGLVHAYSSSTWKNVGVRECAFTWWQCVCVCACISVYIISGPRGIYYAAPSNSEELRGRVQHPVVFDRCVCMLVCVCVCNVTIWLDRRASVIWEDPNWGYSWNR